MQGLWRDVEMLSFFPSLPAVPFLHFFRLDPHTNISFFFISGDNAELVVAIYGPGSEFDTEVTEKLKNGRPVALENWESDDESSTDDDQSDHGDREPTPQIPDTASQQSDSTGHSVFVRRVKPRVRHLGDEWILDFTSTTSLLPVQRAAVGLEAFWRHVVDVAVKEAGKATREVAR
ncbi:MAG: hypothetical protein Q9170_006206, partial [Blastenia crenularia]